MRPFNLLRGMYLNAEALRAKAEHYRALALLITDAQFLAALTTLADQYIRKAEELELATRETAIIQQMDQTWSEAPSPSPNIRLSSTRDADVTDPDLLDTIRPEADRLSVFHLAPNLTIYRTDRVMDLRRLEESRRVIERSRAHLARTRSATVVIGSR
jgi:hypothetical protein